MRNFLTALAVCCGLLPAGAGLGRAQSNMGESAGFSFDTRDDTAHLATESAAFSFDTRAVDGLSGTGAGGLFIFDTRSLDLTPLVVTGPAKLAAGQVAQYRCYSYPLVGPPREVTSSVTWTLDGEPEGAVLSRG